MMHTPNPLTDFDLDVPGVGKFVFAKKSMRDQFSIEAEYCRLTEGLDQVTTFLWNIATATANLKVLAVEAPADWDIDEMDPSDPETYVKLMRTWGALRDKQATFRKKPAATGESAGKGAGSDA